MLGSSWYFAYGSNMNPARVRKRGLTFSIDVRSGTLLNFQLKFNKRSRKNPQAGHANIEPEFGSHVEGVLYELQDDREIEKMDRYESAPEDYRRELVLLQTQAKPILAWTYLANDSVIDNSLSPPEWYIQHLLAGSRFLSLGYIQSIKATACLANSSIEPS